MGQSDYRVIVNETLNLSNSRMDDTITRYLGIKEQNAEDGPIKFNFADIAIVSHDEGGQLYQTPPLEKLL